MRISSVVVTILLFPVLLFPILSFAESGLIHQQSAFNVSETTDKLEAILHKKGMTVFARINHANGAKKTGQSLRPTELLVFGNPKVGTPLMQCKPSVAIDLPQKALIWEDEKGITYLSYNDPQYLVSRHNIQGCEKVIAKISNALAKFAKVATTHQ